MVNYNRFKEYISVGAKVEFVDTLENGTVNGSIEDGYIQIAKDSQNPVSVVIGHEITHRMQQLAPEAYANLRNYIVQTNPELADMVANAYIRAGYTVSGGSFDGTRFSRKIDGSSKVGYNKKKGSVYDEYSTNAMIWANSSSTQKGDFTILNDKGKRFVLIKATDDGYIELRSGRYEEVYAEYERIHSEKDTSFYEDTQEIRAEQRPDLWDMQYDEHGRNVAGNGEQAGRKEFQTDTSGNNEHLWSGNQGKSVKYSIKDSDNAATGKTISWEGILDEVAAEYVGGHLLNSPETINQFIDDARSGKLVEGGTVEQNMGVVKRLWQSIKDFIDKVKKLFKGDKKAQDKAAKDAFGMPMSELEKARDLLGDAFRESERVVKEKESPSQSAELTTPTTPQSLRDSSPDKVSLTPSGSEADSSLKEGAEVKRSIKNVDEKDESGYNNKKYSIKWKPDLNVSELNALKRIIKDDVQTSAKNITKTANWLSTRINGQKVFAIYSTEDAGDPTLLYESKGKRAEFEQKALELIMEDYEYGRSNDEQSEIINTVSSGGWLRQGSSVQNSAGPLGRGSGNRNAGVLQGQSKSKSSRAFKNVIENLFKIQGADRSNSGSVERGTGGTGRGTNSGVTKKSLKMDDVLKQNATLKKAYTQLRAEYAKLQSGKKVADTKRIATVVKNLLDENGFSYSSERLTEQFEGLTAEAQGIFEGKMDFETFSGKVKEVAKAVIDEGTVSGSVEYEKTREIPG